MQLINTSDQPVKVTFDQIPSFLTLSVSPATINPGQKAIVTGTYDGTKNDTWGQTSAMVKVVTNGTAQQNAYYYVSANLVEDFSNLSKEELENAPVASIEKKTVDIGKMKGETTAEVAFKITNTGKRDLLIRHVRSTCGCTAVQQDANAGSGIKPGQSTTIKAVFNSGGYKGKVSKAIYIYTNDPKNSEMVLMLTADVEQ